MTGPRLRLIVVHDRPDVVDRVRRALAESPHGPCEVVAASGAAALHGPRPDAFLISARPGSGPAAEFVAQLGRSAGGPPPPVVVLVEPGDDDRRLALEAIRAGAQDEFELASLTPSSLGRTLEKALARATVCEADDWTARLRNNEERFRAIFENAAVGIAQVGLDGRWLRVNQRLCDILGYPREELLASSFQSITHPDDLDGDLELLHSLMRGEIPTYSMEKRYIHKEGRLVWARLTVSLLRDPAERPESCISIVEDVTEQKRSSEQVQQSERHLRNVLNDLPALVGVLTPEGVFTDVNRPALQATGLTLDDFLGLRLDEIPPFEGMCELQERLRAAVEAGSRGQSAHFDIRARMAGGAVRDIDFMLAPMFDPEGNVTHLIPSGVDVTERKQAAQQVRRSEQHLRDVLDGLIAFVGVMTPDGVLVEANRPALQAAGLRPEDVLGKPFHETYWWAHSPAAQADLRRAIERGVRGESSRYDVKVRMAGGALMDIDFMLAPMFDAEGCVTHLIPSAVNITDRKRMEEALRLRDRAVNSATNGILITDATQPDHPIIYASRGFETVTGYCAEEVIGRNCRFLQGPETDPEAIRAIREALSLQQECRVTLLNYRRDGQVFWNDLLVAPVRDDAGVVTHFVGIQTDVTERVKAEQAVREASERFRRFADSNIIAMIFADLRGGLSFVNDEYLRIIGYTREEFDRDSIRWTEITPPEWFEADQRAIAEAALRGSCTPYEKEYFRKDGSRIPVLVGFTVFDESGEEAVAFILDITERKRAEQALKNADKRKDEYMAMLAHELRNPLAAIRSAVHLIRLKGPADPDVSWGRDVIERQVKHLTQLIDDLLDVSRMNTGKIQLRPELIDVREVVTRAAELARPLADSKHHTLSIKLPPHPLMANGDPGRLEQSLGNILVNAAKYTDKGGRIVMSAAKEGDQIAIRVRDNGIGISAEMLPRVFGLFTQVDSSLDRSQGGLGIGLTLVKTLIEMHGGTVQADSAGPGRGSEFTLRIPAAGRPAAVEAEPDPEPDDPAAVDPTPQALRVLVIDDNVDTANGMARLLHSTGFVARTANDGPSALAAAREFLPAAVLMDIGLPGMNGYDLAAAFRRDAALREATLVAISGYSQPDDRRRGAEAGFDHQLTKPVDIDAILKILRQPDPTHQ